MKCNCIFPPIFLFPVYDKSVPYFLLLKKTPTLSLQAFLRLCCYNMLSWRILFTFPLRSAYFPSTTVCYKQ